MMVHCTWREAIDTTARESDDPDAVVCTVWSVVLALAVMWALALYYLICWML